MNLVDRLPFHDELSPAAPSRLNLGVAIVPAEVELTFIGINHHAHVGNPDYLTEIFPEYDVLVDEAYGWTPAYANQLQKIANGSYRDREYAITSLKLRQQRDTSPLGVERGQAVWDEAYARALYRSKVKIIMSDYPATHQEVTTGFYQNALRNFGQAIRQGEPVTLHDLLQLAKRDMYIGKAICSAIPVIRKRATKLQDKTQLKVIMPYGVKHMSIVEAMTHQAQRQGVTSFTGRTLFESAEISSELSEQQRDDIPIAVKSTILTYQNWLRTTE